MKKFFSKIKEKVASITNSIKNMFNNIKQKIFLSFQRIINRENKYKNSAVENVPLKKAVVIRHEKVLENSQKVDSLNNEKLFEPVAKQNDNKQSDFTKNTKISDIKNESQQTSNDQSVIIEEKITDIHIKEELGIVEFTTDKGSKYSKDIEFILNNQKETYKKFQINKKCKHLTKNIFSSIILRRKLNPIVVYLLNNDQEIENYIKCIKNSENVNFKLKHDLTKSKMKGKSARIMKRISKYEEKIGAEVIKSENIIKRIFGTRNQNINSEKETADANNNMENTAENQSDSSKDKKVSKKERKLIEKREREQKKKDFETRYITYSALCERLFGVKPKKKLEDIMGDVIHQDLYDLTNPNEINRAIATFRVGHRLMPLNSSNSKKYLESALNQLSNENVLINMPNGFEHLESCMLDLEELSLKRGDYSSAKRMNDEYMRIIDREFREKYALPLKQAKKEGDFLKQIDIGITYRKKYVEGQKALMRLLSKSGKKFDAEELYRKILSESGIVLTDEAYDLSKKENCIENGKYIVIANNRTYREPILGTENLLALRKKALDETFIKQGKEDTKKENTTELTEQKNTNENTSKGQKNEGISINPSESAKSPLPEKEAEEEHQIKEEAAVKDSSKIQCEIQTNQKDIPIEPQKKKIIDRIMEAREIKAKEKEDRKRIEREIKRLEEERRKKEEEERRRQEEEKRKQEEERKRQEEEKRKQEEERKRQEEKRKAELAEFNMRFNSYKVLCKGLIGDKAKTKLEDIKSDVIHSDIYDMTSSDDVTKGISTFRVGHRLASLPNKRKEAEKTLKAAISILQKDETLAKESSTIEYLESGYLDLGNLCLENNDYPNAEKNLANYMETVKREKRELYDPKIMQAQKEGRTIDEIDLWIKVKSKVVSGKKAIIKMLSRAGQTEQAEEYYKQLLQECKIGLNDEEYQLSVNTNCIENGKYMRITENRTYCEPILGSEYLMLKRRNISNKALSER